MKPLNIQTVQAEIIWEDPKANFQHFNHLLSSSTANVDLIILPEMFSTGFTMNPSQVADFAPSTIEWMATKAKEKDAVLTGSIVVKDKGQYYNRLIWMEPNGQYKYYDKRHLFGLAGEDKVYSPGQELKIFECKGWKICPLICYDLRFPAWSRNSHNYDLLIYVASWPAARVDAWKALLIGRAIENQSYTIGVNRVGRDENDYSYSGDSSVVDYAGKLIYRATGIEQISTLSLNYEDQQAYRAKLPYLKDQDVFEIKKSLTEV